ncbi:pyridoxamine 5'-phosphate oxidase family protein [Paenibacillus lentus]|uniref:Pyridoxamine 5'-phosphate oxidase family protein n=2 Tax=Paenibacillus lentus TaxID=1338368 RepID=A0A3S8S1S3_9BACL|nr:pyridoxamine 5'-phosphate oxidase family protein [Paenibacillus lentus]AZK49107.1 pyridoxamine 5'-phosphate oxidase family protein [Paenibacillus lentus]
MNNTVSELSPHLYTLFNGRNLGEKQHEAFMLLTVTEQSLPHTAMISVGEVIALTPTSLRLGLWENTTTTNNIIRTGQATIVVFYNEAACYIQLELAKLPDLSDAKHPRTRFSAKVVACREDKAQYADIISGVQIRLKEPAEVLERWEETLLELCR